MASTPSEPGGGPGEDRVRVGRLGRTHGIAGEIYLDEVSLTPLELHEVRHFTWRRRGAAERELTLETARPALHRILVRFAGVDVREQAAELTNGELWAPPAVLPDPGPTMAYTFQLIGLRVETREGRVLGTVADVITGGAQPIYVVRGERELMIPGAADIVTRVDLAAGRMEVDLPPGLEEL